MERREIRGARGIIGHIEIDPDGIERIYSVTSGYLGMYNPNTDMTIAADGRTWIGNKLYYLLKEDDPEVGRDSNVW